MYRRVASAADLLGLEALGFAAASRSERLVERSSVGVVLLGR